MSAPKRIAVVGAGPAGAYAAAQLRVSRARPEVDVFERLPTPWGLLRGGVAPDHGEIKALGTLFGRETFGHGCRFFGNVEVGRDVSHADLMRHYHAVVYAVGARSDKSLGIAGEDLPGSLAATDLVGWYNGHPDYRYLEPNLDVERAVVIGNGNVAADVTRVLTRSVDELAKTDIADHALEALRESSIEEVVVLGRRGPAQAAFTSAELRELGHMDGVALAVESGELDPVSQEWLDTEGTFTARRNVKLIREFGARAPDPSARARITLRFFRSPVSILGADAVQAISIARTELVKDDLGAIRARNTDEIETIDCGLVLRSVGYQAVPLPDVPFDERAYVMPNDRGRVAEGVYCVGWIKRGPTGILGTNKRDAEETVRTLLEDIDALPDPPESGDLPLGEQVVGADGWYAIDRAETSAGAAQERPRVKLTTVEELLSSAAG